ncbi:MAG: DUF4389 domain-containing protein [Litoreibacter sp.]|nr:DUF4389 domain-containing protein [Litoreibacter sp.]
MAETHDTEPEQTEGGQSQVLMRGLWMLIIVLLLRLADFLLLVVAVLQFGWLLFAKKKNDRLAEFGEKLGNWLLKAAKFQSAVSEEKPFPWTKWE